MVAIELTFKNIFDMVSCFYLPFDRLIIKILDNTHGMPVNRSGRHNDLTEIRLQLETIAQLLSVQLRIFTFDQIIYIDR